MNQFMISVNSFCPLLHLYRYNSKTRNAPSNKKFHKQIKKLHTKVKKDLEKFPLIDSNLIELNLCK